MPGRHHTPPFAALIAAALLAGPACKETPTGPGTEPLQTDRPEYRLQDFAADETGVDIPYTYRNTTGATVYLVNCQGGVHVYLEQRRDGEWVTAYAPTHLGCLSPPIAIAPNETFADTLRVRLVPGVHPGMLVDEVEGTYRLVWLRQTTVHHYDEGGEHGWGDPLPLRHRVSNPFALLEP